MGVFSAKNGGETAVKEERRHLFWAIGIAAMIAYGAAYAVDRTWDVDKRIDKEIRQQMRGF